MLSRRTLGDDGAKTPDERSVADRERIGEFRYPEILGHIALEPPLGAMHKVGPAGYAGLEDAVDWHWDRILAGATLSTPLGVGAELAVPQSRIDQDGNRTVIEMREGAQDTVNQVGQEMTKRNASILPTLTVRPGFPMRVMVNKDLVLRLYRPLTFTRGSSQ